MALVSPGLKVYLCAPAQTGIAFCFLDASQKRKSAFLSASIRVLSVKAVGFSAM
jgi:hypothetical protein